MKFDVIVIGGGPSGMMVAGRAGELGAKVLLIEKNERLGKKLSLTGGGRCNITNAEFNNLIFLSNFPQAKHFLFSPFSQFNSEDTFKFFESRGLKLKIEDRKRAFPITDKADDVWNLMENYVKESGNVTIKLNTAVSDFVIEKNKVVGIKTSKGVFEAKNIIVAAGGLSSSKTGSTGDGFRMLAKLGHTIHKANPGLVPLKAKEKWVQELSGVSVNDIQIRFFVSVSPPKAPARRSFGAGGDQPLAEKIKERGNLLFTHFGISGPMIINSSYRVKELLTKGNVIASIDFFPDLEIVNVDKKLLELFSNQNKKSCKNVLQKILTKRIVEIIFTFPNFDFGETKANSITKDQRKKLVHILKDFRFTISGTMGYEYAIVADGGVDPKEIDFKTMQSRLYSNVYCIGDVLDINRPSGGFSLQLCWTTGFVAGKAVAAKLTNK